MESQLPYFQLPFTSKTDVHHQEGPHQHSPDVHDEGQPHGPEEPQKAPSVTSARGNRTRASSTANRRNAKNLELEETLKEHHDHILNTEFFGTPLEEVDPCIIEDTFCALSKKFNKYFIFRFSASKSLWVFGPSNPIRKLAIGVITHQLFDSVMILTIGCNCITLALTTNEFDENGQSIPFEYDIGVEYFDSIFLGVYITEMVLKIIAKGFVFNKFAYLRNHWNILDFFVVMSAVFLGLLEYVFDVDTELSEWKTLRVVRVLRVVKMVTIFPGMRTMVNSLFGSARALFEVMSLNFFCLIIFSLFALAMYKGDLRQKCVLIKGSAADVEGSEAIDSRTHGQDPGYDAAKLWYNWVRDSSHWAQRNPAYPKAEPQPCGNDSTARSCPPGYVCLNVGGNPDDGWTSFDNIFLSMLTTFQLLTTDFWERPYELVLSTSSYWSLLFFITVLFFGSFYLLNLMLAVVAISYETEALKNKIINPTKAQLLHRHRRTSVFSFEGPHRLNLRTLTKYRRLTPLEKQHKINEIANRDVEHINEKPLYQSIPNDALRRPTSLGETILGLLGRRLTLDEAPLDRFATSKMVLHNNDHDVTAVTRRDSVPEAIAVPIIPIASNCQLRHPSKQSSECGDDSNSDEEGEAYEKIPPTFVSGDYPEVNLAKIRFQRKLRKLALSTSRTLRPIVSDSIFENFITFIIVVNTAALASEHHNQPEFLKTAQEICNQVCLSIFAVECVLKIIAYQKEYFQSGWNKFDLIIVLGSLLDIVITIRSFTFVRGLRLLRVFKLAQTWITLKVLLNIIFTTFSALGNLTMLLLICIYIFSILGMQVVGPQYTPEAFDAQTIRSNFPRWNFQNFGYGFMMIFRIICGEWIETMSQCFTAHKESGTHYKCFLVYFPTLVVGNFVVLNLFLALLLESFNSEDLKAAREKELEASGKKENLKKIVILLLTKKDSEKNLLGNENADVEKEKEDETIEKAPEVVRKSTIFVPPPPESLARIRFKMAARKIMIKNRVAAAEKRIEETIGRKAKVASRARKYSSFGLVRENTPTASEESEVKVIGNCCPQKCTDLTNYMICRNLGATDWTKWDNMRNRAVRIVGNPVFEYSILVIIFASSITLCFEDVNLEKYPLRRDILFGLNCVFCVIFICEMIIKWFALGLWGYVTNTWCILDVFIVIVSVTTLYFDISVRLALAGTRVAGQAYRSNFAGLKALRTLRALRPLRAISRWEGMKIVVNALMYAIPLIFNVLLVCLIFWLVFAIMGVQLFAGEFYKCVDEDGNVLNQNLAPNKRVCCSKAYTNNYSWINTVPNFDHVWYGYLSLFHIATFEGWMELMVASVDAVGVDQQPIREYDRSKYLFYVIFILCGAFFTLNLFIGVMVDNFGMLKKKYEGNLLEILLTPSQRKYYSTMKKLTRTKPRKVIKRPENVFLAVFYDFAISRRFEIGIFAVIFLNLFELAFEVYDQRPQTASLLVAINVIFTCVYFLEAIIKLLGFRHYYFTQAWNAFDFVLMVCSVLDIVVTDLAIDFPVPPAMLRIVRVFRIGRILRLIKAAKGIRKLLAALFVSLPALANIGALIALITFIYAILGMACFSGTARHGSVDQFLNWDTFLNSCVVLLRLMLAAGWNDLFDGLMTESKECGSYRTIKCGLEGEPDCPSRAVAVVYFVSYIVIVFLIIINMYTAIILENYVEASQEEEVGIVEDDLEMFYNNWSRYDPQATQFIDFGSLPNFLSGLQPPFQIKKPNSVAIVAFNLPICRGKKIHCLEVLHALVKRILGQIDDSEEFRKLRDQLERKFQKQFAPRKNLEIISSTRIWKIQHNAAVVIQRAWRAYYKRTHPVSLTEANTV